MADMKKSVQVQTYLDPTVGTIKYLAGDQFYANAIQAGSGGTPAITLGTVAATGVATSTVLTDATIVAFDATAPTTSAVGDAAAVGSVAVAARRDHGHGREAFSASTPGTSAAAGVVGAATTLSRSDHVHPHGSAYTADAHPYTTVSGFTSILQSGGTSTFGSTSTFFRSATGNVPAAAMSASVLQASGGGTGVIPLVGAYFTADVTGGTFSNTDHAIGALGRVTLSPSSIAGAGYYGLEGRCDHTLDATGNPTGWGVLGLSVMNTNTPANNQYTYGVEGRIELGAGVTGIAKQVVAGGKFSVTIGAGTAFGALAAYNAIIGDGNTAGNNFPMSLRGYSSKTGNTGAAAADYKIVDLGVGGAYLFEDLTDAKLAFGRYTRMSDAAGAAVWAVQDSAQNNTFAVTSAALATVGGTPNPGKFLAAGTLTAGGLSTASVQVCNSGPLIYSGSGAPTISAGVKGSLYMRTDGTTTATRMYVATDTAGAWTAVTTAT